MIDYPPSLKKLIKELERLPGVGPRTAERFVFFILSEGQPFFSSLIEALSSAAEKIKKCSLCGNYSEEEICSICSDESRDRTLLCVVEHPRDLMMIEKTDRFKGLYHVLGGVISPLDGISPEKLNLASLFKKLENDEIVELLFALSPRVESEATIGFIQKKIKRNNLKITKLASGIPVGAELEFTDSMTLRRAIESRNLIQDIPLEK